MDEEIKAAVEELVKSKVGKAEAALEELVESEVNRVGRTLEERTKSELNGLINQRVAEYRTRFKYFAIGFGVLVGVLVGGGLLGGADLLRTLHDKAFPPPKVISQFDFPAISYEASFELRGDVPELQSNAINFYAHKGQQVEAYAQLIHRFTDRAKQSPVVVSVDGNPIRNQSYYEFLGGFQNISDKLDWDNSFTGEPNVHSLGFALDDTKMRQDAWLTVVCVILVRHRVKDE